MRRYKKGNIRYILIILLLGIGIGYAYLNSTLNINGTTNVSSASWNIYWNNIQLGSNNVTDVTTPATISTGKTEVTFAASFTQPGDTYEFTVDAVNDGTIDAMIDTFSNGVYAANGTTPKNLPDYLEYTVTYSDGVTIAQNQLLEAGDTETYKVRVHFKEDITASQLPSTADNFMFKFSVTYVQADSNAIEKPVPDFTTDSWENIINNARNNPDVYELGDTKEIDMGELGTHTLRISNTTTPAECSTTGFSQTACGFVLEFADVITIHYMNSTSTNVGGWPASEMRTYVNSDIYNALPEVLRNAIINTTVVSGHGTTSGETNFTSIDKIYLLGNQEVFGDFISTAASLNRMLDYYAANNNKSARIKQRNGSDSIWFLRTPYSYDLFWYVTWSGSGANGTGGSVSPAFRIA